jgi:hypothetical protein
VLADNGTKQSVTKDLAKKFEGNFLCYNRYFSELHVSIAKNQGKHPEGVSYVRMFYLLIYL